MIDLTTMDREPETVDEAQYERGMTLGLRLVVIWHIVGAAAAVVMMLLASRSATRNSRARSVRSSGCSPSPASSPTPLRRSASPNVAGGVERSRWS